MFTSKRSYRRIALISSIQRVIVTVVVLPFCEINQCCLQKMMSVDEEDYIVSNYKMIKENSLPHPHADDPVPARESARAYHTRYRGRARATSRL